MDKHLLELYSDYLLSSFWRDHGRRAYRRWSKGPSAMIKSRAFCRQPTTMAKRLWQHVKPLVHKIQQDDGVLIVDDTIQAKPHTD